MDNTIYEEENSSAQNMQAQEEHEEEGDLQKNDQARIAVTSLLDDSMPAVATSRKRSRATAALDEVAGPATINRSQYQGNGAGVSLKRPSKPSRPGPSRPALPVVNLDSDPLATDDDEGEPEFFDLTERYTFRMHQASSSIRSLAAVVVRLWRWLESNGQGMIGGHCKWFQMTSLP